MGYACLGGTESHQSGNGKVSQVMQPFDVGMLQVNPGYQAVSRHCAQAGPTSALTGCLSSEVCTSLPSVSSMMATEYLQTEPPLGAHLTGGSSCSSSAAEARLSHPTSARHSAAELQHGLASPRGSPQCGALAPD